MSAAPLDAALPWIETALDLDAAAAPLTAGLRSDALPSAPYRLESARLARHKPGRRALIEYSVVDRDGIRHGVLLKGRARGLDRRTIELHDTLAPTAQHGWTVPRALGVIPEFQGWLQERHVGQPGFGALAGPDGATVARAVGAALAGFHHAAVTERRHLLAAELDSTVRHLAGLAAREPALGPRLDRIQGALVRRSNGIPAGPLRLLHRDFYPDQFLIEGTNVVLLDLDLHAMGDPALDLGNFVGHLIEHDIRTGSNLGRLGTPFLDGYRRAGGWTDDGAIEGFLVLTLARHIVLSTTIPGRGHTTLALVDRCEQRLIGAP